MTKSVNGKLSGRVVGVAAVFTVAAVLGLTTVLVAPEMLQARAPGDEAAAAGARIPAAIFQPVDIADIIERVAPAVVSIHVSGRAEAGPEARIDPQFEEFFRRFFGEAPGGTPRQRHGPRNQGPRVQGLGSGFIIDKDGFVVTNNHVIGAADEITVAMKDGKRYPAKLVGRDAKTDIALLKIEAGRDLPFVRFGRSEDMRVGNWVVTIGAPFGLGQTATTGIISARHRNIGNGPFDDFLQIDAPINQGNSGGPAFNLAGEVIGINTAIFSPSGGNVGIGFAIPSSLAKDIVAQLKADGKVARGWLGVHIQAMTDDLAAGLGLAKSEGAIISKVVVDGPAAKAKLRQGDVILAVDGKRIETLRDLPRTVARIKAGSAAELTIWRDGGERMITVIIGRTPASQELAAAESPEDATLGGLTLAALDTATRRAWGIGEDVEGVLIAGVAAGSPAADTGLRAGDVILAVDNRKVRAPGEVRERIGKNSRGGKKAVLLLVNRGNVERFVALPLKDA